MKTSSRQRLRAFTLIELLVVIAIIGVLIGLLLPAVQKVREAAQRVQCRNNLHQLGLALHSYHDANQGFPPAAWTQPTYGTTHPWTVLLLPYFEQGNLYAQYRFDKNWDDAATNDANPGGVIQVDIATYLCPAAPSGRKGSRNRGVLDYSPVNTITRPNSYVKNMPPSDPTNIGILGKNVSRRLTDITDGASQTILLAEDAGRNQTWQMGQLVSATGGTGAWGNPATQIAIGGFNPATKTQPGPCAVNCTNNDEIYSFHPGSANALFADGSVQQLRANLDINIAIALMTRSIGEVIDPSSYSY